jgi:hypothetical protein
MNTKIKKIYCYLLHLFGIARKKIFITKYPIQIKYNKSHTYLSDAVEGEDFGEDGGGFGYCRHGFYGEGAALVALADCHALRVALQVVEQATEHG